MSFKFGDRVRVKTGFYAGQEGVLVKEAHRAVFPGYEISINNPHLPTTLFVFADNLELVTPEPAQHGVVVAPPGSFGLEGRKFRRTDTRRLPKKGEYFLRPNGTVGDAYFDFVRDEHEIVVPVEG